MRFLFPRLCNQPSYFEPDDGSRDHIRSYRSCDAFFVLSPSSVLVSNEILDHALDFSSPSNLAETIERLMAMGSDRIIVFLDKLEKRIPALDCSSK